MNALRWVFLVMVWLSVAALAVAIVGWLCGPAPIAIVGWCTLAMVASLLGGFIVDALDDHVVNYKGRGPK